MAFSSTVFAADVKFSGEFYMQGWYNKNASLLDKDSVGPSTAAIAAGAAHGGRGGTAFYTERLRVKTTVGVAKGLTLVTRFDALERKWLGNRRAVTSGISGNGRSGTDSEAENIQFEVAYMSFATPFGLFMLGNIDSGGCTGTCYTDAPGFSSGVLTWVYPKGPWTVSFALKKSADGGAAEATDITRIGKGTDNDTDTYALSLGYRWKTGAAGASFSYVNSRATNVDLGNGRWVKAMLPAYTLYFTNKFGKLYIGEEFGMVHGKKTDYSPAYEAIGVYDVKNSFAFSNAFNVELDLAPAKIGGWFIYSRGDKPGTLYKKEGGFRVSLDLDRGFNPCLILFDENYMQWMAPNWTGTGGAGQKAAIIGNTTYYTASTGAWSNYGVNTYVQNVLLLQLYGDFNVTPKLNLGASYTFAKANEPPVASGWVSKKYGSEVDLTLKYKIYDNLEYMIGAGYLFTGDYFKGTVAATKLTDNYLITHKLTLTF